MASEHQPISAFINARTALRSFVVDVHGSYEPSETILARRPEWHDIEYRQAYAEAAIEQGVAWQVRVNREQRGLTQGELAAKIQTQQSAVSRMEDPEYGAHSLQQLIKVAHAFDCALLVKFISYATLAREGEALSPDDLYASSYTEDLGTQS